MGKPYHILFNGLSIGSGGGLTVGYQLAAALAQTQPTWQVTLALSDGNPLHQEAASFSVPPNMHYLWAPQTSASLLGRCRYERQTLTRWVTSEDVDWLVQLNGMLIPGMPVPTLAHNQDPWPYRREAWSHRADRLRAFFKRRAHLKAHGKAAAVSWTSGYLRDLLCNSLKVRPKNGHVLYNGLPPDWLKRHAGNVPSLRERPAELLTVSNVNPYKRQDLVIQALATLVRQGRAGDLQYRIVGACSPEYKRELQQLADSLGVGSRVHIEGRVSEADVKRFLNSARCFVMMSVCESFSIPIIEAMSFGVPVIAANCCAMPEVGGDAAVLCSPDREDELVEHLAALTQDTALAQARVERGFQRMAEFSWHNTALRLADAISA